MDPLTAFPTTHVAGDTLAVLRSYATVPVGAGWTVKARFTAGVGGHQATVTAQESGTGWLFTLSAGEAAKLPPGLVTVAVTAEKGGERYTVDGSTLTLRSDPSSADRSTDPLAVCEDMIARCDAALAQLMTDGVAMYQLPDGVMVQTRSPQEVTRVRAIYAAKKRRLLNGGRPFGVINLTYGRA